MHISEFLSKATSAAERRLMLEYGAVFVTVATPPPVIMFSSEEEVSAFQSTLQIQKERIGDFEVELQAPAISALLKACDRAREQGLMVSARFADSGRRLYSDTVALWRRNVERGLAEWSARGSLSSEEVLRIQALNPVEQVPVILQIEEDRQIYFGTYFNRSILHSVAAPGASQHLAMLAIDIAEYADIEVQRLMAAQGWFQTVVDDTPHFTYLGHAETALPGLGLIQRVCNYDSQPYRFWVPDFRDRSL